MNWLGVLYYLIGLAMGMEIAYLITKHRCEVVLTGERNERMEILQRESETLKKWRETIDLNNVILELNRELIDENKELRERLNEKD